MTNYKVTFGKKAQQDMTEITDYISNELSNPTSAFKILKNIRKSASTLKKFPKISPVYISHEELKYEYRQKVVGSYSLFYTVNKTEVIIQRVLFNRMDFDRQLK